MHFHPVEVLFFRCIVVLLNLHFLKKKDGYILIGPVRPIWNLGQMSRSNVLELELFYFLYLAQ